MEMNHDRREEMGRAVTEKRVVRGRGWVEKKKRKEKVLFVGYGRFQKCE